MQNGHLAGALIAFLTLPGTVAMSGPAPNPMQDVCTQRAQKNSGYRSQGPEMSTKHNGVQMRLSGSVALGGSRSRGAPSTNVTPPFAGAAATERRDRDAKAKYQRIYDACMQGQ